MSQKPTAGNNATPNATSASFSFLGLIKYIISRHQDPATVTVNAPPRPKPEPILEGEGEYIKMGPFYEYEILSATPAVAQRGPSPPPIVTPAPYWRNDWGPVPSLSDVALYTDGLPSHTEVLDYINGHFKFNSEARNAAFDILLPKQNDSSGVPVFRHLVNTAAWRMENPDYSGGFVDAGSDTTDPEDEAGADPRSVFKAIPDDFFLSEDQARAFLERHLGTAYGGFRRGSAASRTSRRSSFASSSQWSTSPSPSRTHDMDTDMTMGSSADESEHPAVRRRRRAPIPTSVHHSPSPEPGAEVVTKRRTRSRRPTSSRRPYGHGRPSISFTLQRPAVEAPRTPFNTPRSQRSVSASYDLIPGAFVESSPGQALPEFVEGSSRDRVRSCKRARDEDDADDEDETARNASGQDDGDSESDGEQGAKKRRKL